MIHTKKKKTSFKKRMISKPIISTCICIVLILTSCIKNNPDPSWLIINEWSLHANPDLGGDEGELTENLSDAWVYVNDACIGVFELPIKIPVLKSGEVNVKIYPAIKNNGISAEKKIYPFCERYEITCTLIQNEAITINPETQYVDNLTFIKEDFEGTNVSFENDPNTSIANFVLDNVNLEPFNGNAYARITMTPMDSIWVAYTTFHSYLPKGKDVYLEIDYYNTISVNTGVVSIAPSGIKQNPNIRLNKQDPSTVKWKKMYIDLREIIGASPNDAYFDHTFEAWIEDATGQSEIRIDNLKVIYL